MRRASVGCGGGQMQPTTWNDAHGVQFVIDMPIPSAVAHDIRQRAERFLDRFRRHGGNGQLIIHVKRVGPQAGCHVHLIADKASQHGFETDWDVRKALDSALDGVQTRLEQWHGRQIETHA